MSTQVSFPMLAVVGWLALLVELAILVGLAYGAIRFATMLLQMRRDIIEIKATLQDMKRRNS